MVVTAKLCTYILNVPCFQFCMENKVIDRSLVCAALHNIVRLNPLVTAATIGLLYQPQMIDDGDCGAVGGMKIGKGTRSTRRKPAPVLLCPPQIPHDLTWA
jgi:hypothetical protein